MSDNVIEVLDRIGFDLDESELLSHLHVSDGSEDAKAVHKLVETVRPILKPKAVYRVSYIERRDGDKVRIDGAVFESRVLSANLRDIHRVFPYIATCGRELDELDIPADDLLRRYWVDAIKGMALHAGLEYLYDHLRRKYFLEKTATMSPGAAHRDVWPIEQQRLLFGLFGNVEDLIGVRLTDSLLMTPNKSVSGICFPTEINFKSCQVCKRKNCPSRAAPFDKALAESYSGSVEESNHQLN